MEIFHWKVIFRGGESYIYAEASEAQAHLARLIQGSHDSKHGSITFSRQYYILISPQHTRALEANIQTFSGLAITHFIV